MNEKILGYLLLAAGVFVMLFSVGYVWLVFTNKVQPIEVIKAKSVKFDVSQALTGNSTNPLSKLPGFGSSNSSSGIELFSGEDMSKTINLSITFFLMTFVMLFGFRLSSLGVMLMRPIVVKVKEAENKTPTPS